MRSDGTLDALPGTFTSLLRTQVLGPPGKLELLKMLARPARMATTVTPGTSVQQWIDGTSRRSDVRAVLALLARISTYCGDLDALDAAAGVAQMVQAFTHGVVYLDDGWQQLVDELQQLAAARDITLHTRAKVTGIEPSSDGVTVRTAHGALAADAVVLASGGPRDVDTMVRGASGGCASMGRRRAPGRRDHARRRALAPAGTRPAHHVRPRRADVLLGPHALRASRSR